MTKKLWILCLMTVFAVGASAQSLIGKWAAEPEKSNDATMTFVLNFKNKSNVELGLECNMSDEEMIVVFDLLVEGKYTRDGNKLTMSFNSKDAKFNLKKIQYFGKIAEAFKADPELEKTMNNAIMEAAESIKKSMVEVFPDQGDLTIFKLTSTTLSLGDEENDTYEFKRVK